MAAMHSLSDHTPSHPYNGGREHVGFFTDQAGVACAPSAKHREVFGKGG